VAARLPRVVTEKCGHESRGPVTKDDFAGEDQQQLPDGPDRSKRALFSHPVYQIEIRFPGNAKRILSNVPKCSLGY
jgi:hypothetical protein